MTAVIPIKHHSSRVPGKNYRLLNGVPLYHYIIKTLLEVEEIENIIVDTDSDLIAYGCKLHFPTVQVYRRPDELQGDDVSTNKLLLNVVTSLKLNSPFYLHTHTTNPLLTAKTISDAIKKFKTEPCDSLFSVNKKQIRLYNATGTALNHDPENLVPTQTLTPIYEENSCMYITSAASLLKYGRRIGAKPLLFTISSLEAIDIDYEEDFQHAAALLKHKVHKNTVVVTGALGGIGYVTCQRFAAAGWSVIGIDCVEADPAKVECMEKYICGDITDETVIMKIAEIDANTLVNNAAVNLTGDSINNWDRTFDCNVRAAWRLTSVLAEKLTSVVNIASVHAEHTSIGNAAYASSKGALVALTRAMALDLAPKVRVNAVLPGAVMTPMLDGCNLEWLIEQTPLKKIGEPKDIAQMIYFLADDELSGFCTGGCYLVDGGVSCRLSSE